MQIVKATTATTILTILLSIGCDDSKTEDNIGDTGSDGDTDSDTDGDTDTDTDGDTDTDTDGDSDSDTDTDSDGDTQLNTACIGVPFECDTMFSACESQAGCSVSSGGCSGISPSCFSYDYDRFGCEGVMGCTWDESCSGFADSCSLMFNSFDCMDQDGCTWSSSSDSCSGVATRCSSIYSEFSCDDQEGCEWEESCEGVSTSCSSLSAATCELQDGCSVSDECSGTPLTCDTFSNKDTCGDQLGCWWSTGGMPNSGAATAKFCNALVMAGGEDIVLDVVITAGKKSINLSANSGECSTEIGDVCLEAPIGDAVHIEMRDPDGDVIDDTLLFDVEKGDEIIITNDAEFEPEVVAAIVEAPDTCSSFGFVD